MVDWINIDDRLPELNELVLIYQTGLGYYEMQAGYLTDDLDGFYISDDDTFISLEDVTHWMPSPAPPKYKRKDIHSRWIRDHEIDNHIIYNCENCYCEVDVTNHIAGYIRGLRFCPRCGAKMDKVVENDDKGAEN